MKQFRNKVGVGRNSSRHLGFTIVELLIVIVVIAILAAITVVAFNGVQNRANDAAVQSDLSNIAKKYELYRVDSGVYPYGATLNDGTAFTIKVAKSAYDTTLSYQLLNCTSSTTPGSDYAMLAVSKSGKRLYVSSSSGGVKEYTGADTWLGTAACPNVLAGSSGNGAGYAAGAWRAWTN